MSDVMLFGVLKMPYEMTMASELSRIQFYQRVQELVARFEEQPEQEPVATVTSKTGNSDVTMSWWHEPALPVGTKLYTTPPKRPWVGLTDEEIWSTVGRIGTADSDVNPYQILTDARSIEAKLKEKNT